MNKLRPSQSEKESQNTESKPEQLAKIMYEGIVRYMKAKKALTREKNAKFELDSDRVRRVNVHSKDIA